MHHAHLPLSQLIAIIHTLADLVSVRNVSVTFCTGGAVGNALLEIRAWERDGIIKS